MGQKLRYIQAVFNKGELSSRVKGRVDNQSYYKAYDRASNMLPFPEGAITFRPGTVYVAEAKDSSKATILAPFRFSTVQNYILEFGDQYVRFYRNRGRIESGGSPYEVSTPYLEADLRDLYFFQSADVFYILHPNYQPRRLVRTSDTNWSLSVLTFTDGPYLPINATATTLTQSATTVTASTSIFVSSDVGRMLRIRHSGDWRPMTITAFISGTQVTVDASHTITATTEWRFGAFGGNRGWPAAGSIFEERLILGGTVNQPSTVWGSVTGAFENFAPSNPTGGVVGDDDGFAFTIGDDQVNSINWISSGRQLLIGTSGAVHSMTGGSSSGYAPISPSNVTVKRENSSGTKSGIRGIRVGNATLYPSQSGRKLNEMYYEFGIDSYISRDMTIFSNHVLRSGIIQMAYAQEPDPYLWCATGDGRLACVVYDKTQEIEGWHTHDIAGVGAAVKSVAVIPVPGDETDELWLVVERTINGVTKKYVEYLSPIYENVTSPIKGVPDRIYAKYLDSCITYDGYYNSGVTLASVSGSGITVTASTGVFSSTDVGGQIRAGNGKAIVTGYTSATEVTVDITTAFGETSYAAGEWSMQKKTFTGLGHLEGETVSIVADGYVTDSETVVSGSISIDNFASVVHAGLKYSAFLRLLLPDFPSLGTIQGREKSTSEISIFMTDSYGLSVKDTESGVSYPVKFLNLPLVTEDAPPLLNGLLTFHPPSGYEKDSQIEFTHDLPMPLTINYVVMAMDVNA